MDHHDRLAHAGNGCVMKASCGSSHHAMQAYRIASDHAAPVHAQDRSGNYGAHDGMLADHAHSGHTSALSDFADKLSPMAHADKSVEHDGPATCSACASCNVRAVAPPSAHVKTPELSTSIKSRITSSSLLAGFIPTGLERPPRIFFA